MPVKGKDRRSFNNRYEIDMPDGGYMKVSIADDGQINISIKGRSYQLQSMWRGGDKQKGIGGANLILTPDKKRR